MPIKTQKQKMGKKVGIKVVQISYSHNLRKKWLKIPHSKNFTAQKLKFLDVTKGICVKPGSALIHAHHRVRSLQVERPAAAGC